MATGVIFRSIRCPHKVLLYETDRNLLCFQAGPHEGNGRWDVPLTANDVEPSREDGVETTSRKQREHDRAEVKISTVLHV